MPFIQFEDSTGRRGIIVPDGLGGTKFLDLLPEESDADAAVVKRCRDDLKVLIEPVPVVRVNFVDR